MTFETECLKLRLGLMTLNPLVPSVINIERLTKILISIWEEIIKKNPMSIATMSR